MSGRVQVYRVLAPRLRACWHILRGRRVIYGMAIEGGSLNESGWQNDLVLVNCRYLPEFSVNGTPAIELRGRFGDVRVPAGRDGQR